MTAGPFAPVDWFDPDEATMREIATRCRCPQRGDTVRVGDVVALGIEPGTPHGRIVARVRRREDGSPAKGMHAWLVRCYRKGDSWFPTGEMHYGAIGVAWVGWVSAPKYRGLRSAS